MLPSLDDEGRYWLSCSRSLLPSSSSSEVRRTRHSMASWATVRKGVEGVMLSSSTRIHRVVICPGGFGHERGFYTERIERPPAPRRHKSSDDTNGDTFGP